ncbi:MAG: hypothetical protein ACJ8HI_07295 [Massilia sp.]|jgi:hypothetical protein
MTRSYIAAGIGLLYAMVIVGLIAAKLAGHIAWAWWIVLSPIWAPFALVIAAVIVSLALLGGAMSRGENPFQ